MRRDLYTQADSVYSHYRYNDSGIKRALRDLLLLESRAEQGDSTSHAIWIDLQNALGGENSIFNAVTTKQREAIFLHLVCGYSEAETAAKLGISQQAVSCRIQSGIKRIKNFLQTGEIFWNEWTPQEEKFLIDNYKLNGAAWCARELARPITQIYSRARILRERGLL